MCLFKTSPGFLAKSHVKPILKYMEKILALDDDRITLEILKSTLSKEGYEVECFNSGEGALEMAREIRYDLVLSDLLMPTMGGEEFLAKFKRIQPEVPFIFLTAKDDLLTAVQLMKLGADDYIHKPVNNAELIVRVRKTIQDKRNQLFIQKTLNENKIDQLNEESILHWKRMYGVKDTQQTNRIMRFLSRNVEQGGGFMWLELLKAEMEAQQVDTLQIDRGILELVTESASRIKGILDDLNYISSLSDINLDLQETDTTECIPAFLEYAEESLAPLCEKYEKKLQISTPKEIPSYPVHVHKESIREICHELTCNAIKFSPDNSSIILMVSISGEQNNRRLEITLWNDMRKTVTKDDADNELLGIPYQYSESIFELFHTLEGFPFAIDEEKWKNGTGLYAVRELIKKMKGIVEAGNTIMYINQEPHPYVKVGIYLPIGKSTDERKEN